MQVYSNCMKLPSLIEMRLLTLVAVEEMAGRDVAEAYHESTGETISYGTLYTTFRRMHERGWVKVRDDEDQDGRVRYFKIDADGRRALAEGRESYAEIAAFGLPKRRFV